MPDKGLFDIHCHIVPSVDDGASSAEEAYKMLQMEYRQVYAILLQLPITGFRCLKLPLKQWSTSFWY